MNTLTSQSNAINISSIIKGGVLPLGILAIVAMMILPLPVFLLDLFFVTNILVSLLVLMVAMHTNRPLDFSSFPSLLLIATILRLALNVASTRIVLSQGHTGSDAAGQVIEAFGNFVIAGNYAVGIFIFIILVIINLVVITKGAGRVSEVTARFTLDAMPGKQMAIDADINAGILTPEEATLRREELTTEADFYGSMDGASKFVKGDAVAGILILVINVVGGLIIGISQYGLSLGVAAETYTLLSIGDGLVAQIPSLLLAIATAIIVTRVSASGDMAEHIGKQVSLSKAWLPVSGVLLLIGFVPGMPNILFLGAALIAATFGYFTQQREKLEKVENESGSDLDEQDEQEDQHSISLKDVTDYSPVSIQLGYGLVEMVADDVAGPLITRVTGIRRQISKALGFVVPAVRIRDDLTLEANQYRIRIGQTIVGEDKLFPDRKLAIPGDESNVKIAGIEVKDPSFGLDAFWIVPANASDAEDKGYVIINPESVMATHLSQLVYKHAGELIGQDDVQELLDNLAETSPNLVQSVVPKLVPLHTLTGILRELLNERVPISDLKRILEVLPSLLTKNLSIVETAEAIRPALAGLLIQQVAPLNETLPIITFDSELEHMLITMSRQSGEEGLVLDSSLAKKLLQSISDTSQKFSADGKQAVLVVSPEIRRQLSHITRQHIDDLLVLAFTELPEHRKINIVATISNEA